MVLFLIRVLIVGVNVRRSSNEGFTQHSVVIHQLTLRQLSWEAVLQH